MGLFPYAHGDGSLFRKTSGKVSLGMKNKNPFIIQKKGKSTKRKGSCPAQESERNFVFPGLPESVRPGNEDSPQGKRALWSGNMMAAGLCGGHPSEKSPPVWDNFLVIVNLDMDIKSISGTILYSPLVILELQTIHLYQR